MPRDLERIARDVVKQLIEDMKTRTGQEVFESVMDDGEREEMIESWCRIVQDELEMAGC